MSSVWFWRHGQTDFNVSLRLQGQSDIALNEIGRAQAERGAQALDREIGPGPLRIVSSPLVRALETAQAFADRRGVELVTDARLTERSFGQWEGLTREEVAAGWPEAFSVWESGGGASTYGVETNDVVAARVAEAVEEHVAGLASGEQLLVVGHGSATTVGITRLIGWDLDRVEPIRGLNNCHWSHLELWARQQENASGVSEEIRQWRIRAHNAGAGPARESATR